MATTLEELYRSDFYAWTKDQAAALRRMASERWNGPLDLERLAEEVEDVGCERRFAVEDHLTSVIEHLLKLEFSCAEGRRYEWLAAVLESRREIERRMTPTMRAEVEPKLDEMFRDARYTAALRLADEGDPEAARSLPHPRAYPLDQLLDKNWLPVNRYGLSEMLP